MEGSIFSNNLLDELEFSLGGLMLRPIQERFYFTNIGVTEEDQKAENIAVNSLTQRLEDIRKNIGDELFYSLSFEERQFIAETAGMLDLGPKTNLERIFKFIEEYEDS